MNIQQDAKQLYSFQMDMVMHKPQDKEFKHATAKQREIFERYDKVGKVDDLIAEVERVGASV